MKDNTPGLITYQSAQKLKRLLGVDKRRPKNTPHDDLFPNISQDGFWARIEGRTSEKPVDLTGDEATKQLGCYRWNRIIHSKNTAQYNMWNQNKAGNFNSFNKLFTTSTVFEGDYKTEAGEVIQENFAVESAFASQHVLNGDIVWLRPSVWHPYYIFDYNPPMRLAIIQEDVPPATLAGNVLTYGKGKVSPFNAPIVGHTGITTALFTNKYSTTDTAEWKLEVFNPFRADIEATVEKPIVCQIQYYNGYWFLAAVECSDANGVEI
jgi:hypothetical protein